MPRSSGVATVVGGQFGRNLVKSVNELLRKLPGHQIIGFDEMVKTATETKSVFNSQPLGYFVFGNQSEHLLPISVHLINDKGLLGSAVTIPNDEAQSIQRCQKE